MATKRSAPYVHPSRNDQVPEEPRRKRHKPDNAGPKSFKKAHPVNELKSQVRSLRRLLERNEDLPADVRVEKERALRHAQHELKETENAKQRSDMIGKYHKIRFFERQKATKRLKKAQKALDAHSGDEQGRKELTRRVDHAKVDVNYALYYPLDQPYVSLFPRKPEEQDADDGQSGAEGEETVEGCRGNKAMWQRVRNCMAEGTLDALRNGVFTKESEIQEKIPSIATARREKKMSFQNEGAVDGIARKARNAKVDMQEESDNESDGGFFE